MHKHMQYAHKSNEVHDQTTNTSMTTTDYYV